MCRWVGWCRTVWRFANFLNVLHLCWHLAFPIRGFSTPGLARGHRGISQCWQELPPSRHSHSRLTWRHSHFPAREDDLAAFLLTARVARKTAEPYSSSKARSGLKLTRRAYSPVRFGVWVRGLVSDGLAFCQFSQCSPYDDVAAVALPSDSMVR